MKAFLKETRATTQANQMTHAPKEKVSMIISRFHTQQAWAERVDQKLQIIIDEEYFYWDQSQLLLNQGRLEESKEANIMGLFYRNKKTAYKLINTQIAKQFSDLEQKLQTQKFLRSSAETNGVYLPPLITPGYLFTKEQPKLKPQISSAARNEKIKQLEKQLIEYKIRRNQCQERSSFYWKQAAILQKCGQHQQLSKEREAWKACFKEVMLWHQKIRLAEDEVYHLMNTGVREEPYQFQYRPVQ